MNQSDVIQEINHGVELFVKHYHALKRRLKFDLSSLEMASPLVEFIFSTQKDYQHLLLDLSNFDAWGSSRNLTLKVQTPLG